MISLQFGYAGEVVQFFRVPDLSVLKGRGFNLFESAGTPKFTAAIAIVISSEQYSSSRSTFLLKCKEATNPNSGQIERKR